MHICSGWTADLKLEWLHYFWNFSYLQHLLSLSTVTEHTACQAQVSTFHQRLKTFLFLVFLPWPLAYSPCCWILRWFYYLGQSKNSCTVWFMILTHDSAEGPQSDLHRCYQQCPLPQHSPETSTSISVMNTWEIQYLGLVEFSVYDAEIWMKQFCCVGWAVWTGHYKIKTPLCPLCDSYFAAIHRHKRETNITVSRAEYIAYNHRDSRHTVTT